MYVPSWLGIANHTHYWCFKFQFRFQNRSWNAKRIHHGICENITWHAKMSQMPFSRIQGNTNLNWFFEATMPTIFGCIYKMLVACASENKGRSLLNIMTVMFFIVTSNAIDSNQNITFMVYKDTFLNLWTCVYIELISKMQTFPKLKCTPQNQKLRRPWETKCHMWMWCSHKYYVWAKNGYLIKRNDCKCVIIPNDNLD